ncbi:MAG TPA: hypothetical protein VNC84_00940 [Gammaproteobacteria bacterium]|jgi:hypothetical protein|nr:hypothetical protein [Gammaproteobacteria bacterium]
MAGVREIKITRNINDQRTNTATALPLLSLPPTEALVELALDPNDQALRDAVLKLDTAYWTFYPSNLEEYHCAFSRERSENREKFLNSLLGKDAAILKEALENAIHTAKQTNTLSEFLSTKKMLPFKYLDDEHIWSFLTPLELALSLALEPCIALLIDAYNTVELRNGRGHALFFEHYQSHLQHRSMMTEHAKDAICLIKKIADYLDKLATQHTEITAGHPELAELSAKLAGFREPSLFCGGLYLECEKKILDFTMGAYVSTKTDHPSWSIEMEKLFSDMTQMRFCKHIVPNHISLGEHRANYKFVIDPMFLLLESEQESALAAANNMFSSLKGKQKGVPSVEYNGSDLFKPTSSNTRPAPTQPTRIVS